MKSSGFTVTKYTDKPVGSNGWRYWVPRDSSAIRLPGAVQHFHGSHRVRSCTGIPLYHMLLSRLEILHRPPGFVTLKGLPEIREPGKKVWPIHCPPFWIFLSFSLFISASRGVTNRRVLRTSLIKMVFRDWRLNGHSVGAIKPSNFWHLNLCDTLYLGCLSECLQTIH